MFKESLTWSSQYEERKEAVTQETLTGNRKDQSGGNNNRVPIQNTTTLPVMVGGDVVVLYPSMKA